MKALRSLEGGRAADRGSDPSGSLSRLNLVWGPAQLWTMSHSEKWTSYDYGGEKALVDIVNAYEYRSHSPVFKSIGSKHDALSWWHVGFHGGSALRRPRLGADICQKGHRCVPRGGARQVPRLQRHEHGNMGLLDLGATRDTVGWGAGDGGIRARGSGIRMGRRRIRSVLARDRNVFRRARHVPQGDISYGGQALRVPRLCRRRT